MAGLLNFEVPGGMNLWDYVKQRANDPLVPPPTSRMIQNDMVNKGMEAVGMAPLGMFKGFGSALDGVGSREQALLSMEDAISRINKTISNPYIYDISTKKKVLSPDGKYSVRIGDEFKTGTIDDLKTWRDELQKRANAIGVELQLRDAVIPGPYK